MADLNKPSGFIEESGTYEAHIYDVEVTDDEKNTKDNNKKYKVSFDTAFGKTNKLYYDNNKARYFLKVLAQACNLAPEVLSNFQGTELIGCHCIICGVMNEKGYFQIDGVRPSEKPFTSPEVPDWI